MKAKRILVPTDFSTCSKAALSLAVDLAQGRRDTSVTLLHVVEPTVPTYDESLGVLEPEALRTEMEMLTGTRGRDVNIEAQIVHGDPREVVVEFAEDHAHDLIVIGTHGRSGLAHLLVGSTAEAIMRRAKCPVITVRETSREAHAEQKVRPAKSAED